VTKRGLSGGEKKRVNIGLELMARPALLFLDEPTSGLDAASSLLVVNGLKTLTVTQGVTICSVIHQPRKFIFEAFDNLVLLTSGGKMVYHGKTMNVNDYFSNLGYVLPLGENVADWAIDIATGSITPDEHAVGESCDNGAIVPITAVEEDQKQSLQRIFALRNSLLQRSANQREEGDDSAGVSAADTDDVIAMEQQLREYLTNSWNGYFTNLSESERTFYLPPEPFEMTSSSTSSSATPNIFRQTSLQITRRLIVMRENKLGHVIDLILTIVASLIIGIIIGVVKPVSSWAYKSMTYYDLANSMLSERPRDANNLSDLVEKLSRMCAFFFKADPVNTVAKLTQYATVGIFGLNIFSVIVTGAISIVIGIASAKPIKDYRLEFYREAGSGYSIAAYYIAISFLSAVEFTVQMIISSFMLLFLRQSLAPWRSYLLNSILLAWISSGWGQFYATWVSQDAIVIVIGFHMILMLFLSGGFPMDGFNLSSMANNPLLNSFAGLVAPGRFFIEAYAVNEAKCLAPQSGFTSQTLLAVGATPFHTMGMGAKDPNVAIRSCDGWYWNYLPMFLVGLTVRFLTGMVMHGASRTKMPRTPLLKVLRGDRNKLMTYVVVLLAFVGLLVVTLWSFLAERGTPVWTRLGALCDVVTDEGTSRDPDKCETYLSKILEKSSLIDWPFGNLTGNVTMANVCAVLNPSVLK